MLLGRSGGKFWLRFAPARVQGGTKRGKERGGRDCHFCRWVCFAEIEVRCGLGRFGRVWRALAGCGLLGGARDGLAGRLGLARGRAGD
jgi:hypothetical protein